MPISDVPQCPTCFDERYIDWNVAGWIPCPDCNRLPMTEDEKKPKERVRWCPVRTRRAPEKIYADAHMTVDEKKDFEEKLKRLRWRERYDAILRKHYDSGDAELSDRAFIDALYGRFTKYNDHYLVDVAE